MKALHRGLGIVAAGLLLTAGPALAQKPDSGGGAGSGGDRASSTSSGGSSVSNNNGGGGGVVNSSGGGSAGGGDSSGGGAGFSSPSASVFSSPSVSMGDRAMRTTAPEHRLSYSATSGARSHTAAPRDDQKATPRSSGGSSSSSGSSSGGSSSGGSGARSSAPSGGDRAVTRGSAAAPSNETAGSRRTAEGNTNNASGAREVPNWSRPRGDRPVTGTAVERVGPRPGNGGNDHGRYDGYGGGYYYDPFYYGGFGYGLSFYDHGYYGYPFYSPFGFGYGVPYGYFDPFYGDPYDYGGGYGSYSSRVYGGQDQGSLKLKVKPRNAKVYVDGYYVGLVDQFDGAFQKVTLNGGRHKVEVRAEGYETAEFDVLITPENTVTFAGDLKKIK